ncbi:hypothetical protein SASPL_103017 [Salvia splendens]|uniref:Uncharacterized protein n=1 Tax=Salvia splendens TaxID=180675 RepID=A0A8X8YT00_SALSN|nr:hypothetical protein SASPL_103017 [Salvia splendens]
MMSSNNIHSQRNIPFSWENAPGVSKAVAPPQPPQPEKSRVSLQIPLPPCANSSKKKGEKKNSSSSLLPFSRMDDPFLIAYKEVTKSTKKGKSQGFGFGVMKKNISIFSCKQSSCGVAGDSVVRLSRLPLSRSRRD